MSMPLAVRRRRTVLRVWGREPVKMLNGLATADMTAVAPDRAVYTTFLTPKGRMVADGLVLPLPGADPPELLLATDPAAAPGLVEHLRKFVPPLFARFEDISDAWAAVGVYGAGASAAAEAGLRAAGVEAALSPDVPEYAIGAAWPEPPAVGVRSGETGEEGWDLYVGTKVVAAVERALAAAGAGAGTEEDLEPLRIAAGRPRWGAELTESVIPLEAGLLDRAISQTKGCYTGQEVIVRILHRGHVNRHLRALSFTDAAPAAGTELFEPGNDRPRGVVTSVAAPGGGGGVAGLGYVRREVEPPAELRAGSPDGSPVRVTALP